MAYSQLWALGFPRGYRTAGLPYTRAPVSGPWPLGLEHASFPGEILDLGQRLTKSENQILAGGPSLR